jgi:hypothetical protein
MLPAKYEPTIPVIERPQTHALDRAATGIGSLLIKGKAIPLQAWTGPEGSRRLRLSDFKTIGT